MNLTIIRIAATAAVAGLSSAYAYYPHQVWIPCVLAAIASVGIHAIPAIGQTAQILPSTSQSTSGNTVKSSGQPFTGE